MPTLQADIDDLDRMVDTGAQKDAIRSQIRLIAREVAALEADYANLAQAHANLQNEHSEFKADVTRKISEMNERSKKEMLDWMAGESKRRQKLIQSKQLKSP
jgi:hypothetical protein